MPQIPLRLSDCAIQNIMMDASPMYPNGFHPHPMLNDRKKSGKGTANHWSGTSAPVTYYLIDFGLSWKWEPEKGPRLIYQIEGNDRTVPEFQGKQSGHACDPFPVDIYYLGNLLKEEFLDVSSPFNHSCIYGLTLCGSPVFPSTSCHRL
jgi:hypothetical protein